MIELGKMQTLTVQRVKEFGVYLGEDAGSEVSVLLPKKQVPEGTGQGDEITVFILLLCTLIKVSGWLQPCGYMPI